MTKKNPKHVPLPTKDEVLAFIQDSPGRVGKRELARAFNLSAEDRPLLRQIIKDLEQEGRIQRGHKRRFHKPGLLPEVTVVEITGTDRDGELIGRPMTWLEDGPPPRIFVLPARKGLPAVGVGDRVLCRLTPTGDSTYDGRIIKRLEGAPTMVLGMLEVGTNGLYLRPADRRDKQDYVIARGDALNAEAGDLVEAELMPGRRYGLRQARVVQRLGSLNDPRAVSLIAIHAHGIPTEFTIAALEQAEGAGPAPETDRVDLRGLPLVTIDGEDARDFDDAVWAEPDGSGGWHALVAIADVSHYVRSGSPLDEAAYERGNSVYFPDRVVPMLPEALSNGWCSLRPDEDRSCMAVHMWFDAKGHKYRHEFVRGTMRSTARLTYDQVQKALDGVPDELTDPLLDPVLKPLYGCFRALRAAREHRGALEIEIPERKILLDEQGNVTAVVPRPHWDAHRLIEELMIAANVCAAETLEALKQPCMYRVHDEPPLERVQNLRDFLQTMGLNFPTGAIKAQNFNYVLEKVKGTAQEHLVNTVVLRSQSQAIYSPDNRGHFGLGLRRYAHFTSPIRRYSDLLVHRALITGLNLGAKGEGLSADQAIAFEEIGEHISQTERRAAAAERDCVDRFTAQFLASKVGAQFTGRVTGVNRFGLFVELDESGASGLIPISTLPNDYYLHEEAQHRLVGRSTGAVHQLGDSVVVHLRQADSVTGGMIFELMENTASAPGGLLPSGARKAPGYHPPKADKAGRKRVQRESTSRTAKVARPARRKGR